ncbi:MAG: pyridoxamine 5'-phosphate oxidase, partial [Thermodesulfobacteriota bacterium]
MTDNSSNQHGSDYKSDNTAKPSFSESVKTLIYNNKLATLSTLSKKYPDCPFGSLMPYAIDDKGRPIFLISTMA